MEGKPFTSKKADNGLFGFVDKDGKWISEPIYEQAAAFHDEYEDLIPVEGGIGFVKLNGKKGYLMEDGSYLWAPMSPKKDKGSKGLWGIVDKDGKWFVKPQYPNAWEWEDYIVIDTDEDISGIMNLDGSWHEVPYWDCIEESEDKFGCLDMWYDGDLWHFYPDGNSTMADMEEDDDEDFDDDEDEDFDEEDEDDKD